VNSAPSEVLRGVCAVPGARDHHRYAGFSEDPLRGFTNLACDLENFAIPFLRGAFAEFSRSANAAANWKKLPGLAKLF
jgi:hypothetical protein